MNKKCDQCKRKGEINYNSNDGWHNYGFCSLKCLNVFWKRVWGSLGWTRVRVSDFKR